MCLQKCLIIRMGPNCYFKYRKALADLQKEYEITDRIIINSLTGAINGFDVRTKGDALRICKLLISFDRSVINDLPFYSGCYWILGCIIEEEVEKKKEGMGLNPTVFLLRLCVLDKLVFMIGKSWKSQERTPYEFANYFNRLFKKEKELAPKTSHALYDGFLRRWNELYNPKGNRERPAEFHQPENKRRKVTIGLERDAFSIEFVNTVVPDTTESLSSTNE